MATISLDIVHLIDPQFWTLLHRPELIQIVVAVHVARRVPRRAQKSTLLARVRLLELLITHVPSILLILPLLFGCVRLSSLIVRRHDHAEAILLRVLFSWLLFIIHGGGMLGWGWFDNDRVPILIDVKQALALLGLQCCIIRVKILRHLVLIIRGQRCNFPLELLSLLLALFFSFKLQGLPLQQATANYNHGAHNCYDDDKGNTDHDHYHQDCLLITILIDRLFTLHLHGLNVELFLLASSVSLLALR